MLPFIILKHIKASTYSKKLHIFAEKRKRNSLWRIGEIG